MHTFSTTKNWFPVTIKLNTEKEILIRRYICVILIFFNCLFYRINCIRLNRIPISSNVALNLIFKYFITNQLINRDIERIIITFLRQGIKLEVDLYLSLLWFLNIRVCIAIGVNSSDSSHMSLINFLISVCIPCDVLP